MIPKTTSTKRKQLSRGQRTHVRRMKQEARKANVADNLVSKKARPSEVNQAEGSNVEK